MTNILLYFYSLPQNRLFLTSALGKFHSITSSVYNDFRSSVRSYHISVKLRMLRRSSSKHIAQPTGRLTTVVFKKKLRKQRSSKANLFHCCVRYFDVKALFQRPNSVSSQTSLLSMKPPEDFFYTYEKIFKLTKNKYNPV